MQWQKEIKIYLLLFVLLSLSMHFGAWTGHPLQHLQALSDSSLGPFHPFVITLIVYLILFFFRFLWRVVTKFKR